MINPGARTRHKLSTIILFYLFSKTTSNYFLTCHTTHIPQQFCYGNWGKRNERSNHFIKQSSICSLR